MSNPMRVAFVMEGPTDYIVLRAAVRALLGGRDFVPTAIKPELNNNLSAITEGGWGGVYKWCRQAVAQTTDSFRNNPIFAFHDAIVIQIDADVAQKRYSDYRITDAPNNDLPLSPPNQTTRVTTDALRQVVLGWLNETSIPNGSLLCVPSRSIETWLLVALFPNDKVAQRSDIEASKHVESRLKTYKFIKSKQKLIGKYISSEGEIQSSWPSVRKKCAEAERFSTEFLALVPSN